MKLVLVLVRARSFCIVARRQLSALAGWARDVRYLPGICLCGYVRQNALVDEAAPPRPPRRVPAVGWQVRCSRGWFWETGPSLRATQPYVTDGELESSRHTAHGWRHGHYWPRGGRWRIFRSSLAPDDGELNTNPPTPCQVCKRPPAREEIPSFFLAESEKTNPKKLPRYTCLQPPRKVGRLLLQFFC